MCWTSIRYQILDGTTKFLLLKVLTIEHWQDIELARSVFDWRISAASKVSLPSVTEYFYNLNVAFIKAHCQRNSLYSIQAPFFILKVLWVSSCQELHHILALEELRKFHYHQWRVPRHAVNFISRNPPNVFKRSLHCESIVSCCQELHHILALKELRRFTIISEEFHNMQVIFILKKIPLKSSDILLIKKVLFSCCQELSTAYS